ncbi:MAG TPA: extracellular solute-binding protein [Bacilli bacterium]
MKRSLVLLLALATLVSVVLAGCGDKSATTGDESPPVPSESEAPSPSAEKVEPFTITLRHIQIGEPQKFRLAMLKDVVAKTEAEVAGLKIELDGVEDQVNRFTKLPAEMAAGNPPQIFDLFGGEADAKKYAKAGRLLELTPILEELGIKDQFLDLSQFTVDGKIYGLPIGGSTEGFFYNKPLFEKYGLKVPTTWDELENILATLKENNVTPMAAASKAAWVPIMTMNSLYARFAGPDFIQGLVDGSLKWTDPTMLAAASKFEEWEKKGYFTKGELGLEYNDIRSQLITGKAALMFDGSWASSVFKDPAQAGDMVGKIGFFALPPAPNGVGEQASVNGNFSNGYGFKADLNDNELKAVKSFIKNLYNQEMQVRGLLEDGVLPSMKMPSEAYADKVTDQLLKEIMATMSSAKQAYPVYDAFVPSNVYSETEKAIQKLIGGKATAQQMLQEIQDVVDGK